MASGERLHEILGRTWRVPRHLGPGASHLMSGLYDVRLDHTPVLAVVSQPSRDWIGGHYQREGDLVSLFKDAAD
jgi:thiamine pyrophosphate-dependent acetolactate synthase large subunit-like protein